MKTVMAVSLSSDLIQQVEKLAERTGRSRSNLVESALQHSLDPGGCLWECDEPAKGRARSRKRKGTGKPKEKSRS